MRIYLRIRSLKCSYCVKLFGTNRRMHLSLYTTISGRLVNVKNITCEFYMVVSILQLSSLLCHTFMGGHRICSRQLFFSSFKQDLDNGQYVSPNTYFLFSYILKSLLTMSLWRNSLFFRHITWTENM